MPIRPEFRNLYPANWPELSRQVRFERAGGRCERCGKPHGVTVRRTTDGRWFDPTDNTWRDRNGRPARWPTLIEAMSVTEVRVITAACHRRHDPRHSDPDHDLVALCGACHLAHDRRLHLIQRRITFLQRRASGDLFEGDYDSARLPGRWARRADLRRTERPSSPPPPTRTGHATAPQLFLPTLAR